MAVRFSLPFDTGRVVAVKYYIDKDPAPFNVLILDSNKASLYEKPANPQSTAWFTYDSSNDNVLVQKEFYAAMKWTVGGSPSLGTDESSGHGRSFFVGADGTWTTYHQVNQQVAKIDKDGDFMIRVSVVQYRPVILVLQGAAYSPSATEPFYVGDLATATYTFRNDGQAAGKNLEVKVATSPPEIQIVQVTAPKDIQAGSTTDLQVQFKATKPGTYDLYLSFYLDGVIQTLHMEGADQDRLHVTVIANERPFMETYGLYLIVGAIAAVVVVVLLLFMRRGRAQPPPPVPIMPSAAPFPPAPYAPPPAAGAFCMSCGSPMPTRAPFCPRCGARQT